MNPAILKTGSVRFVDTAPPQNDVVSEIMAGLRATPKRVSPKFFYDEYGSHLFEKITATSEYYPTRTERRILRDNAEDIARRVGRHAVIVEPGAGSCEKIRLLLNSMRPRAYVPLDISGEFLCQVATLLQQRFPWLEVTAICADFTRLSSLPEAVPGGRRVVFYPGSTLGNLERDDALAFLRQLRQWVGDDGGVLLGVDQHKSTAILEQAYNDSAGYTAAFNLNVLSHLNRRLPANFDTTRFRHLAFYNASRQRIEMHLESLDDQTVSCAGELIDFREGEKIHTENSHKYTADSFRRLASAGGFRIEEYWSDEKDWFRVYYLT